MRKIYMFFKNKNKSPVFFRRDVGAITAGGPAEAGLQVLQQFFFFFFPSQQPYASIATGLYLQYHTRGMNTGTH